MSVFSYLYRRKAWLVLREEHLRLNPFCVKCMEANVHTLGNTVDHKVPHKGDMDLFFDKTNLQTMCHSHHSKDKQIEERRGFAPGCDAQGNPLDPRHPFFGGGGVVEK
jgi:5-methylcytosine-specific restriction protein A